MYSRWISCLMLVATLTGCSVSNHEDFVHNENHRPYSTPGKRQLVVFMDGTGNDVSSRTNVRRLFEMTVARSNPDILAYYDPGVGTGRKIYRKVVGGAFGLGFQGNLREAMSFLTENYRKGDEISIFGFSRGAYSAGVLASIVSESGIPALDKVENESNKSRHDRADLAVGNYYRAFHQAELDAEDYADSKKQEYRSLAPDVRAECWRKDYWNNLKKSSIWLDRTNRNQPRISVLGLWDPVDSLVNGIMPAAKIGWSVSDISEFSRHRGHHFHPYVLGSKIESCYIAASLDEQRQAFSLELPDHKLGQPKNYEIVGFIGDHSDLGGGHSGDKDLSGISFNWMLSHVGDRLLGRNGNTIRVYENYSGARHDLSVGTFYNKVAFRIRGEFLGERAKNKVVPDPERKLVFAPKDASHLTPVRYQGWKIKIHSSVLKRMQSGKDYFYKPYAEGEVVNLAEQALSTDSRRNYINQRNPVGPYHPRALRKLPAVGASDDAWIDHDMSVDEIRKSYDIVGD